jgi:hypothetical protein
MRYSTFAGTDWETVDEPPLNHPESIRKLDAQRGNLQTMTARPTASRNVLPLLR